MNSAPRMRWIGWLVVAAAVLCVRAAGPGSHSINCNNQNPIDQMQNDLTTVSGTYEWTINGNSADCFMDGATNLPLTLTAVACSSTPLVLRFLPGGSTTRLIFLNNAAASGRFDFPGGCSWTVDFTTLNVEYIMSGGGTQRVAYAIADNGDGSAKTWSVQQDSSAIFQISGNANALNSLLGFATNAAPSVGTLLLNTSQLAFPNTPTQPFGLIGTQNATLVTTLTVGYGYFPGALSSGDQANVQLTTAHASYSTNSGIVANLIMTEYFAAPTIITPGGSTAILNFEAALFPSAVTLQSQQNGTTALSLFPPNVGFAFAGYTGLDVTVNASAANGLTITSLPTNLALLKVGGPQAITVPADSTIVNITTVGSYWGPMTGALAVSLNSAGSGAVTSLTTTCATLSGAACTSSLTITTGVTVSNMYDAHSAGAVSLQGPISNCISSTGFLRSLVSVTVGLTANLCPGKNVSIGNALALDATPIAATFLAQANSVLIVNAPITVLTFNLGVALTVTSGTLVGAGPAVVVALASTFSNIALTQNGTSVLFSGSTVTRGTLGGAPQRFGSVTITGGSTITQLTATTANFTAASSALGTVTLASPALAGSFVLLSGGTLTNGTFGTDAAPYESATFSAPTVTYASTVAQYATFSAAAIAGGVFYPPAQSNSVFSVTGGSFSGTFGTGSVAYGNGSFTNVAIGAATAYVGPVTASGCTCSGATTLVDAASNTDAWTWVGTTGSCAQLTASGFASGRLVGATVGILGGSTSQLTLNNSVVGAGSSIGPVVYAGSSLQINNGGNASGAFGPYELVIASGTAGTNTSITAANFTSFGSQWSRLALEAASGTSATWAFSGGSWQNGTAGAQSPFASGLLLNVALGTVSGVVDILDVFGTVDALLAFVPQNPALSRVSLTNATLNLALGNSSAAYANLTCSGAGSILTVVRVYVSTLWHVDTGVVLRGADGLVGGGAAIELLGSTFSTAARWVVVAQPIAALTLTSVTGSVGAGLILNSSLAVAVQDVRITNCTLDLLNLANATTANAVTVQNLNGTGGPTTLTTFRGGAALTVTNAYLGTFGATNFTAATVLNARIAAMAPGMIQNVSTVSLTDIMGAACTSGSVANPHIRGGAIAISGAALCPASAGARVGIVAATSLALTNVAAQAMATSGGAVALNQSTLAAASSFDGTTSFVLDLTSTAGLAVSGDGSAGPVTLLRFTPDATASLNISNAGAVTALGGATVSALNIQSVDSAQLANYFVANSAPPAIGGVRGLLAIADSTFSRCAMGGAPLLGAATINVTGTSSFCMNGAVEGLVVNATAAVGLYGFTHVRGLLSVGGGAPAFTIVGAPLFLTSTVASNIANASSFFMVNAALSSALTVAASSGPVSLDYVVGDQTIALVGNSANNVVLGAGNQFGTLSVQQFRNATLEAANILQVNANTIGNISDTITLNAPDLSTCVVVGAAQAHFSGRRIIVNGGGGWCSTGVPAFAAAAELQVLAGATLAQLVVSTAVAPAIVLSGVGIGPAASVVANATALRVLSTTLSGNLTVGGALATLSATQLSMAGLSLIVSNAPAPAFDGCAFGYLSVAAPAAMAATFTGATTTATQVSLAAPAAALAIDASSLTTTNLTLNGLALNVTGSSSVASVADTLQSVGAATGVLAMDGWAVAAAGSLRIRSATPITNISLAHGNAGTGSLLRLEVAATALSISDTTFANAVFPNGGRTTMARVAATAFGNVVTWAGATLVLDGATGHTWAAAATGNSIDVSNSVLNGVLVSATNCALTNVQVLYPGTSTSLNVTCANVFATNVSSAAGDGGAHSNALYIDCATRAGTVQLYEPGAAAIDVLTLGQTGPCSNISLSAAGTTWGARIETLLALESNDTAALTGPGLYVRNATRVRAPDAITLDGGMRIANALLISCMHVVGSARLDGRIQLAETGLGHACRAALSSASALAADLVVGTDTGDSFSSIDIASTLPDSPSAQSFSFATQQNSATYLHPMPSGTIGNIAGTLDATCVTREACNATLYLTNVGFSSVADVDPLITIVLDNSTQTTLNGTVILTDQAPTASNVHCTRLIVLTTAAVTARITNVVVDAEIVLNGTGPVAGSGITAANVTCLQAPPSLAWDDVALTGVRADLCGAAVALTGVTQLAAVTVLQPIGNYSSVSLGMANNNGSLFNGSAIDLDAECAWGTETIAVSGGIFSNVDQEPGTGACGTVVLTDTQILQGFTFAATNMTIISTHVYAFLPTGPLDTLIMSAAHITDGFDAQIINLANITEPEGNLSITCAGAATHVRIAGTIPMLGFLTVGGSCGQIYVNQPVTGNVSIASTYTSGAALSLTLAVSPTNIFVTAPLDTGASIAFEGPVTARGHVVMQADTVHVSDLSINSAHLAQTLITARVTLVMGDVIVYNLTGESVFLLNVGNNVTLTSGQYDIVELNSAATQFNAVVVHSTVMKTIRAVGNKPAAAWLFTNITTGNTNEATLELAAADRGIIEIVGNEGATTWSNITILVAPGAACESLAIVEVLLTHVHSANCGVNLTRDTLASGHDFFNFTGTFLVMDDCTTTIGALDVSVSQYFFMRNMDALAGIAVTGGVNATFIGVVSNQFNVTGFSGLVVLTDIVVGGNVFVDAIQTAIYNPIVGGSVRLRARSAAPTLIDGQGGNTIGVLQVNCSGGAFTLVDEVVTVLDYVSGCSTVTLLRSNVSDSTSLSGSIDASTSVNVSSTSVCRTGACTLALTTPVLFLAGATLGPVVSGQSYAEITVTGSTVASFAGATASLVMTYQSSPFAPTGLPGCAVTYTFVTLAGNGGTAESCAIVSITDSTLGSFGHTGATSVTLLRTTVGVQRQLAAAALSITASTISDLLIADGEPLFLETVAGSGSLALSDSTIHATSDPDTGNTMLSTRFRGTTVITGCVIYVAPLVVPAPSLPLFPDGIASLTFERCSFMPYAAVDTGAVVFADNTALGSCAVATTACATAHYWGSTKGPRALGSASNTCDGSGVTILGNGLTLHYFYTTPTYAQLAAGTCAQGSTTPPASTTTTSTLPDWMRRLLVGDVALLALMLVSLIIGITLWALGPRPGLSGPPIAPAAPAQTPPKARMTPPRPPPPPGPYAMPQTFIPMTAAGAL